MGKKDKEHRKKVAKRNEQLKGLWKKLSKNAWEKHELWKQEQSGKTQTEEIKFDIK